MSLTDKQQAERGGKIGSSDAPVIAGVSPYQDPLTLYHKFRGDLPRYDGEETFEQVLGAKLEPVIADLVAHELAVKIRRSPMRAHKQYPWMIAHPDYEIIGQANGAEVLEIKHRFGPVFDELPEDIMLQVAHQLAVTNRQRAKVAVMFGYGRPKVFDVERDKELEYYLIELEAKFLVRVEKGDPPPVNWAATGDLMKRLYPQDTGKEILIDDLKLIEAARELVEVKRVLKQAETDKAALEAQVKATMQDASVAHLPGFGEITWRTTKGTKAFDQQAFAAAHPDLYQQFMRDKSGFRRFTLKPNKEVV